MAGTLRAALAAKGLKITVSESLELLAKAFGVADSNTLSAAVRAEAPGPRNDASPSPPPITERVLGPGPHFSRELESTLHRALAALRMPQAASDPPPAAVETPAPPEPTVGAAPEKPVPQNETDDCVP
jgi:hypothetical protein